MDNFKLELKLREIPDGRWKGLIEATSVQYLHYGEGQSFLLGGVGGSKHEAILNAVTAIMNALAGGAEWVE